MAWTAPATATVGQILTAAFMNAQLRDNMLLTAPSLVTTDGDMVVATAANTLKRLAAFSGDFLLHELGAWEISIAALTTNDGVGGASAGLAEIKVPVTQAEAEAGTNTRFSFWSSERVKQAIAALGDQAAKAYCQITAAGVLAATSKNVASITDVAAGDRTVVWDTDFGNTTYSVGHALLEENISGGQSQVYNSSILAATMKHRIYNEGVNLEDQLTSLVALGDQ